MTPNADFIGIATQDLMAGRVRAKLDELDRGPASPEARYAAVRSAACAAYYAYALDLPSPYSPDDAIQAVERYVERELQAGPHPRDALVVRGRASLLLAKHRLHRNRWEVAALYGGGPEAGGVHQELRALLCDPADPERPLEAEQALWPEWREWLMEVGHLARYTGDDDRATALYRAAFHLPAAAWDGPEGYRKTIVLHYRASQACNWLALLAPLSRDGDGARVVTAALASAAAQLLRGDGLSGRAEPPFPVFAANYSKHLALCLALAGGDGEADSHLRRAERLFDGLGLRKGDMLLEQFRALYLVARGKWEEAAQSLMAFLQPDRQRYVPRIAYESKVVLVHLAHLDPGLRIAVGYEHLLDSLAKVDHPLAHRRYRALVRNLRQEAQ